MAGKLCLVVDSAYMPRSIVDTHRAFVIVYKGNAEVLHNYDTYFKTPTTEMVYPKPSIIRILKYVNLEYRDVPLTKNNIFKRDDFRCVYCGKSNTQDLTIDHVVPKSRGGRDKWDNVVTACKRCNNQKADLTLEEWGKEDPQPKRPHYLMMMKKTKGKIREEWKKYLFF